MKLRRNLPRLSVLDNDVVHMEVIPVKAEVPRRRLYQLSNRSTRKRYDSSSLDTAYEKKVESFPTKLPSRRHHNVLDMKSQTKKETTVHKANVLVTYDDEAILPESQNVLVESPTKQYETQELIAQLADLVFDLQFASYEEEDCIIFSQRRSSRVTTDSSTLSSSQAMEEVNVGNDSDFINLTNKNRSTQEVLTASPTSVFAYAEYTEPEYFPLLHNNTCRLDALTVSAASTCAATTTPVTLKHGIQLQMPVGTPESFLVTSSLKEASMPSFDRRAIFSQLVHDANSYKVKKSSSRLSPYANAGSSTILYTPGRPLKSAMKHISSFTNGTKSKKSNRKKNNSNTSKPSKVRGVTFGNLEIREYDLALSDHPSVSCGPAIQLGWEYRTCENMLMEEYEYNRSPRRNTSQLILSSHVRRYLLTPCAGYTRKEVREAMREAERVRRGRKVTDMLLPIMKIDETLEDVVTNVKRLFGM